MSTPRFTRIVGTGSHLPPRRLTNADLVHQLAQRGIETSDEWIVERTGIRARHFVDDGVNASDLAEQAARHALAAAGCAAEELDLIIVATSTPDMVFPSTAAILQRKLGVFGCAAFDVQAVCSGFIYALTVADAMMRTGAAHTALVVGTEVFSRILDFNDRGTCVLFGDGAGAVVLRGGDTPGILATDLHADGRHVDILSQIGIRAEIVTVADHGNTSAASIPLALDVAVRDGRIRPGHTVLLEGVGGGFTWGSVLFDF